MSAKYQRLSVRLYASIGLSVCDRKAIEIPELHTVWICVEMAE